jgi:peptidoglycan/LPS O-acetylase OafA/YrhL
MNLSNFTQDRDNNFNLIRAVAAMSVLIDHSFALSIGIKDAEPFRNSLGMSMGEIAVDVFFITSGFLITASLLTRQSIIEFAWARILRIFPALLVMLLLTVFGLGVFFTILPLQSYFTDSKTYIYLLKCATLITGVSFTLPGVFGSNLFGDSVNGSLWTMPYEIFMYAFLAVIWTASRVTKISRLKIFKLAIVTSYVVSGAFFFVLNFFPTIEVNFAWVTSIDGNFAWLFFMFFSGASFYILKENITLSHWFFWLCVIALTSAAIVNIEIFSDLYMLTIAYILFYVAYIPSGYIRKYNQIGDYSYGIYIYAYPVQQSVGALIPRISVLSMFLISAVVTLLLAALSWHLLERRALKLKGFYVTHTRRILTSSTPDTSSRTH